MRALLVSVSIERENLEAAQATLRSQVVPRVSQQPGFKAGYWLQPKDAGGHLEGFSLILFENEQGARDAEAMARQSPRAPGVEFTNFEVREVAASA